MKKTNSVTVRSGLVHFLGIACLGALCAPAVYGQISLTPEADARLSNDANRGPTSTAGSSSVVDVRWYDDGAGTTRIRIGYVRYNITGVDPSLFGLATLSGTFSGSSYNGPSDGSGMWNVYGLNDDVVANGNIQGNDWNESTIDYATAAGVDNSAALGTFAFTSDATFLGTMSFDGVDVQPLPFASNPADLDLSAFLGADTDGLVTFLFMDVGPNGNEYRFDSKEGNAADGHGPMMLNFVPEPSTFVLLGLGALVVVMRKRGR